MKRMHYFGECAIVLIGKNFKSCFDLMFAVSYGYTCSLNFFILKEKQLVFVLFFIVFLNGHC